MGGGAAVAGPDALHVSHRWRVGNRPLRCSGLWGSRLQRSGHGHKHNASSTTSRRAAFPLSSNVGVHCMHAMSALVEHPADVAHLGSDGRLTECTDSPTLVYRLTVPR